MKHAENGTVYHVCAVSNDHWDVLSGSSPEPVASFEDKHAALAYAMSLARERSSWQLPIGRRHDALRSILNQSRIHE